MQELNEIEQRVLEKMFAGEHPALSQLRFQLENCRVVTREWTGSGFVSDFQVVKGVDSAPVRKEKFHFGDIVAEVGGIQHGMGFLVNIAGGYLQSLEGYTFEEPCPEEPQILSLAFAGKGERDLSVFDRA